MTIRENRFRFKFCFYLSLSDARCLQVYIKLPPSLWVIKGKRQLRTENGQLAAFLFEVAANITLSRRPPHPQLSCRKDQVGFSFYPLRIISTGEVFKGVARGNDNQRVCVCGGGGLSRAPARPRGRETGHPSFWSGYERIKYHWMGWMRVLEGDMLEM